jgi:hypothetical protein
MEEEAQKLAERFKGVNRAKFARTHKVRGGQAIIYQHITGRRPIGLDAAQAYARGFNCGLEEISPRLAVEAQRALSLTAIEVDSKKPSLTQEQQQVLDLIGRMDPETGALFIKLVDRLVPDRRKKQAKEGPRARATRYGVGESVRRGDLFEKDESIGRTKNDGDTF